MEMRRLFISLPVEEVLVRDIYKGFNRLNLPWHKIKKVKPDQVHLTIKFLGETPLDKIPEIIDCLDDIDIDADALTLDITETKIYNERQPKVLVLKIAKNKDLEKLYNQVEQKLFDAGLAHKEARNFSAHITLGRVKTKSDFNEFKDFKNWQVNKSFSVSYLQLMESELTKTGPIYSSLKTFDL